MTLKELNTMNKTMKWLAGLSILSASLAWADAPKISEARINDFLQQVETQMPTDPNTPKPDLTALKADITRTLQVADILKTEAFKIGLDKKSDIQVKLENLQAQFYAQQYINYLRTTIQINDQDLRQQYDLVTSEINLLPIAFDSKEAAENGLSKLKKGLSFEDLMKQINPQSPSQSWINPQQLPPEIAYWAMQLKNGQISAQPIVLEGRYYLLKVAGMRHMPNAPTFDKIKTQLREQAIEKKVQEEINKLIEKNGIKP